MSFARVAGRVVVADFGGGAITSDAGSLLLGATDRAIRLVDRFAACVSDGRAPGRVSHDVATPVGQRVFGIALGFEDLVDHDDLRRDPALGAALGRIEARRPGLGPLAGKSMLNRLEHAPKGPDRDRRIGHDPAAIEALERVLAEAVRAETPAHVFLDGLLEAERSGREERRVETMLKTAKIPTGRTLENFDFAFRPAIERSRIEILATGAWIRTAEVILMQGPPGVGQSHLLCGLGIRAIRLGFPVQCVRFDDLLTALRADAHLPPARLKSRKYMSSALLLIDEMGDDPMTREEASLFFRLVSTRYGRGAMTIATNKSIRDWTELPACDEALATAILDRLPHRAHVLDIEGRSSRLRDLEDAFRA